jgi:hypothetical protein
MRWTTGESGFDSGRGKRRFSSSQCPHQPKGQPSLHSIGITVTFYNILESKGKILAVVSRHATMMYRKMEIYLQVLLTLTLDGNEPSASRHGCTPRE